VALGKRYLKTVVFISGWLDSEGESRLRGTGFLVGLRFEADENQGHVYIVIAAHVVRPLTASFVKLTQKDGTTTDRKVDEWIFHPTHDIAVARMPAPYEPYEFLAVEDKDFVGAEGREWEPEPGADVYFVGLLGQVPSMGAQNVPMVRTGSIGALYQDDIPMRLGGDTLIKAHGHLIDCKSFGGFSGSPCFVRYISAKGETEHLGLTYPIQSTLLIGMVGGHFDLKASVTLPDQEDRLDVPVAAGVGVVYPAETIRALLDEDPFVIERAKINAEIEAEATAEGH
jgi:Trypsin-like peptidase domain